MQKSVISTVYRLLSDDQNIRDLVENRIYTFNADGYRDANSLSDALPEITHTALSTSVKYRYIGIYETIYQISCWDNTLEEADAVAAAVVARLEKYENAEGIERINIDTLTNVRDPDTNCYGIHIRLFIIWRKKQKASV